MRFSTCWHTHSHVLYELYTEIPDPTLPNAVLPYRALHTTLRFHSALHTTHTYQKMFFKVSWEYTMARMRHHGVPEMSVNKNLRLVQQVSYAAYVAYDNGIDFDAKQFAGALWVHLFSQDKKVTEQSGIVMSNYVKEQRAMLVDLPIEAVVGGRIPWGPPPGVSMDVNDHFHRCASEDYLCSEDCWSVSVCVCDTADTGVVL